MPSTQAKSIKILAIDGGGIRGIIPAEILGAIQAGLDQPLWSYFDLIAGTSTGGIIALGIGTRCKNGGPYSPQELVDLYVQNGPAIFPQLPVITWFRKFLRSKYSPRPLEATLAKFFSQTRFAQALTPLLVSSYDLHRQLPFFFKSHMIAGDPAYDWAVTEVARSTSAAPTFFPPFYLKNEKEKEAYTLVDGGVFVNNPSAAAYAEARWLYPQAQNFMVVSVGTGDRQDRISYAKARNWGLIEWAKQIIPVLMDSVSEGVDYELRSAPGCTYCRLQIQNLTGSCAPMDNVSQDNLRDLQNLAKDYCKKKAKVLDEICVRLREGRGSDMPGIGRENVKPRYRVRAAEDDSCTSAATTA